MPCMIRAWTHTSCVLAGKIIVVRAHTWHDTNTVAATV